MLPEKYPLNSGRKDLQKKKNDSGNLENLGTRQNTEETYFLDSLMSHLRVVNDEGRQCPKWKKEGKESFERKTAHEEKCDVHFSALWKAWKLIEILC